MSTQAWVYLAIDVVLFGATIYSLIGAIKIRRMYKKADEHLAEALACLDRGAAFMKQAEQRLRAAGIVSMIVQEMNGDGEDNRPETMQ